MEHFSNGAILKSNISQMEQFSNGAFWGRHPMPYFKIPRTEKYGMRCARSKTKLRQWRRTKEVRDWFVGLEQKEALTFLKFDVEAMYPSISEELLSKSLEWAGLLVVIKEEVFRLQVSMHLNRLVAAYREP